MVCGVHREAKKKKNIQMPSINVSCCFVFMSLSSSSSSFIGHHFIVAFSSLYDFFVCLLCGWPPILMRSNRENKISINNYYLFTWWLFNRNLFTLANIVWVRIQIWWRRNQNMKETMWNKATDRRKRKMNNLHTYCVELNIYALYAGDVISFLRLCICICAMCVYEHISFKRDAH